MLPAFVGLMRCATLGTMRMGMAAGLGARTASSARAAHGAASARRIGLLLSTQQAAPTRRKRAARSAASAMGPAGMQQPAADGLAGRSLGSGQLQAGASALDAVRAATQALGRHPGHTEEQLAARLADNWYASAGDIAAMGQEEVKALGLPLRLWAVVKDLLEQQPQAASAAARPAGAAGEGAAGAAQQAAARDAALEAALADAMSQQGAERGPQADAAGKVPAEAEGMAAEAVAAVVAEPLHPDIRQRRMPLPLRSKALREVRRRVTQRNRDSEPYGLREVHMTPALRDDFAALQCFCTTRWLGQVVRPVADGSYAGTERYLRQFLGWLHTQRGVPLDQLRLSSAFPSSELLGVELAFEWLQWMASVRGANARTQFNALSSCVHAVRFLYHRQAYPSSGAPYLLQPAGGAAGGAAGGGAAAMPGASSSSSSSAQSAAAAMAAVLNGGGSNGGHAKQAGAPYGHLPVMQALKQLINAVAKEVKQAPYVSDEAVKWLEWGEFLDLVGHLRRECAGLTATGQPRRAKSVASSLQRYLAFAILSCVPDRQRTLRELELGRTLVRDGDRWVIRHTAADYKTGRLYGERPPLVLAPFLYPELEAFIDTWRAELSPQAPTLFIQPGSGKPFNASSFYEMFTYASERLTGRPINPHLVRDMIVTYLRSRDTSVAELEALAIYMGHSIEMQRGTYDRRTRAQKVTPAVALLGSLADAALGGNGNGGGGGGAEGGGSGGSKAS